VCQWKIFWILVGIWCSHATKTWDCWTDFFDFYYLQLIVIIGVSVYYGCLFVLTHYCRDQACWLLSLHEKTVLAYISLFLFTLDVCRLPVFERQKGRLASKSYATVIVNRWYFLWTSLSWSILICSNSVSLLHVCTHWWWSGSVGSIVDCINKVNQHQTRLVLGWLTIPVCNQPPRSTQPGHPSVAKRNEYQRKLGRK